MLILYFAAPEPEANTGNVEANSEQPSPYVLDAIENYLQNPDPNLTSSAFDELAAAFSTTDKTWPAIDDTLSKTKLDKVINKITK